VHKWKKQDGLNAQSSGGVEYTVDIEKHIDDYISTEGVGEAIAKAWQSKNWVPLVEQDQQYFAKVAGGVSDDPATRSMTRISDWNKSGDDTDASQVHKQSWNGMQDLVAMFLEGTEKH